MIEILNKTDTSKIKDKEILKYLEYSIKRLPEDFLYPEFGYFVVIENFNELSASTIDLTDQSINGLNNGLFNDINMVEMKNDIMEIIVFLDNDISVSLVLSMNILPQEYKDKLSEYVI